MRYFKRILVLVFVVSAFTMIGCSKQVKPDTQDPGKNSSEKTGIEPVKADNKPKVSERIDPEKPIAPPETVTITDRPRTVIKNNEIDQMLENDTSKSIQYEDIYFAFDEATIIESEIAKLRKINQSLSKKQGFELSIEGHCDERGTEEYNLALGDRRAQAVKAYLGSLGVLSTNIKTFSYGWHKPVCDDHTEDCWAKNRRVHIEEKVINKKR